MFFCMGVSADGRERDERFYLLGLAFLVVVLVVLFTEGTTTLHLDLEVTRLLVALFSVKFA